MANVKWSFSGLKQFTNCPRQYYEVKVQRNYEVRETEQIKYGKEVHEALEKYVRDGTPLAKNYLRFQRMVDPFIEMRGEKFVEHKMALTADKQKCDFDSPDYWVRGIADLLIVDNDTAFVVDYKTGSARYPDPKQLKLMALMAFQHFPTVNFVKGGLLFLLHNGFVTDSYARQQQEDLWGSFQGDLFRLNLSYDNDTWPPNPTPLCGWCPVTTCEFHKER